MKNAEFDNSWKSQMTQFVVRPYNAVYEVLAEDELWNSPFRWRRGVYQPLTVFGVCGVPTSSHLCFLYAAGNQFFR